jgi:hypothetical protein
MTGWMDLINNLLHRRHFTTKDKTQNNHNNTRKFSINFDDLNGYYNQNLILFNLLTIFTMYIKNN